MKKEKVLQVIKECLPVLHYDGEPENLANKIMALADSKASGWVIDQLNDIHTGLAKMDLSQATYQYFSEKLIRIKEALAPPPAKEDKMK